MPKLLTISQASDLLGVSKDTLRRWEKIGLISPKRTAGGIRKYSFEDLKKTRFQKGRRLYRMRQLLSNNKTIVKTILYTSLFWLLVIVALKISALSAHLPGELVLTASPHLGGVDDAPKTDLKYSDKSDQYYSLHPIPQNPNPTVIKRN